METQPPVKFGWLALGSKGRKEQLLITDQDNALVFEDVSEENYRNTFMCHSWAQCQGAFT